jgi:general secretion pathway protein F
MPVFAYRGLDSKGKPVAGNKDADSVKGLRAALRRDGVFLTEYHEQNVGKGGALTTSGGGGFSLSRQVDLKQLFGWVRRQDLAIFTRQVATLLKAGIPLTESLQALIEQTENQRLRNVVVHLRQLVNEGTSFADALAQHSDVFPDLYINMVRAGETAGNLDQVMFRLADFEESALQLRSKVQSALIYPAVMAVVGTVIMGILMVFVVPKITGMFADMGKTLPWNTEMLIWISKFIGRWWPALIVLAIVGFFSFRKWRKTPKGRAIVDKIILKLWIFGPLAQRLAISRFAKTLGTMLNAGVPLLRALDIVKHILDNVVLQKVVEEAHDAIREGESIAAPLKRSGHFPPLVTHMIAVGERSGQLEGMLDNVAGAYEREVEAKLGRMTALLEPIMILCMGGVVAFVVFSILMPIMDLNTFVGQSP